MATDIGQKPPAAAPSKYEKVVETQLARARQRIRTLDLATLALAAGSALLAYVLVIALLDRALDLPTWARLLTLVGFVGALAAFVGWGLTRVFLWNVNPYFAARHLEQTLPGSKNSLINWLDLHDKTLSPVVRASLEKRAAHDLGQADLERAFSPRQTIVLGCVLAVLVLALVTWLLLGGGQFLSLVGRALLPFEKKAIATRTEITLLDPAGDATVPVRQNLNFRVRLEGRIPKFNQPDSPKLHLRYNQNDPYFVRPLDQDADGEWSRLVMADEIQGGFWYKITAGDASTAEHQITLRALPQVTHFDVTLKYRPYFGAPDVTFQVPNQTLVRPDLQAPRGTEVTLIARTNRDWVKGHLELKQGPKVQPLVGEAVPDDPKARKFQFVMDRDGSYQVQFTSKEGEDNQDRGTYLLEVFQDQPPKVVLTDPGKDVTLPANGTLKLAGFATDDVGVKAMTLRMKVTKGPDLAEVAPKPYRPGVTFQLENKKYPRQLDYKDFVALEQLKTAKGPPLPLEAGMELEYWLEASDNCDYPEANVGRSARFKVLIAPAEKDAAKQKQDRQQAEKEQQQSDKKQDDQQKEESEKAKQDQKNGAGKPDPANNAKNDEARKDFEDNKNKVDNAAKDQQKQEGGQGEAKGDPSKEQKGDKKEQGTDGKGERPADAKPNSDAPKKEEAGKQKDQGQQSKDGEQGAAKDSGQGGGNQQAQGAGKNQGAQQPEATPQGSAKEGQGAGAEQKLAPKEGPKEQSAQAKKGDGGQLEASKEKGPGDSKAQQEPDQGQVKGQPEAAPKSAEKQGGGAGEQKAQGKAGNGNQPGKEAGQKKEAAEQQAKNAGQGKADKGEPKAASDDSRKGATTEDVAKLQEKLQRPEQMEDAAQELDKIRKEAADAQARKDADEALKKNGLDSINQKATAKENDQGSNKTAKADGNKAGPKDGNPMAPDGGQAKPGPKEQQAGESKKGGDPQDQTAKGDLKPSGDRQGNQTKSAPSNGNKDDPRADPANPLHSKRAGDLNLEDLKKKLTPDVMKKLNWTEQDREKFLADAEAYQRWLRQQEAAKAKNPLEAPGANTSLMPNQGLRKIGSDNAAPQQPLEAGQARPPREYLDAHRNFTTGDKR